MKLLAITLIVAATAVYAINDEAEGRGKGCCDRRPERDNRPERERRECPRPGELDPKFCGLGRCECPDKCSALWFPQPCDVRPRSSSVFNQGFGSVFCQDFFFTCDHECRPDFTDLSSDDLALFNGFYEVRSACIAFESYDRPLCFLPEAGCITSNNCELGTTLVQLHGSNFTCVGTHPELLRPGCHKSCPKGYYPTCLLVKKFFNFSNTIV